MIIFAIQSDAADSPTADNVSVCLAPGELLPGTSKKLLAVTTVWLVSVCFFFYYEELHANLLSVVCFLYVILG